MGSVPGRSRRLESALSICLLGVLFLIAVGIFIKQKPQAGRAEQVNLSSLTPPRFKEASNPELYDSANLYEKINGKAPFYIESGFEKLSTQRFAAENDMSLSMELYVYDMGAARNAFSVYSVQKRREVEVLPHVAFGYKTANALYFVHGKYYIELIGSCESGELSEAMGTVAEKFRRQWPVVERTDMAELDLFAQKDLVGGSIKLYRVNAFGFEGLSDTFAARYQIDGGTITAFLSKRSSPQEAKSVMENYYNFLINSGGVARPVEVLEAADIVRSFGNDRQFKVIDFYGTTEIIFSFGPFVAGVHEAENQRPAVRLAVMLLDRLSEVVKAEDND